MYIQEQLFIYGKKKPKAFESRLFHWIVRPLKYNNKSEMHEFWLLLSAISISLFLVIDEWTRAKFPISFVCFFNPEKQAQAWAKFKSQERNHDDLSPYPVICSEGTSLKQIEALPWNSLMAQSPTSFGYICECIVCSLRVVRFRLYHSRGD